MLYKKPRLDLSRSFYFELSDNTTAQESTEYELFCRARYTAFRVRVGLRFYFEFDTPEIRDAFILAMETDYLLDGNQIKRVTEIDYHLPGSHFTYTPVPFWHPILSNLTYLEHLANSQFLGFNETYLNAPQTQDLGATLLRYASEKEHLRRTAGGLRKRTVRAPATNARGR